MLQKLFWERNGGSVKLRRSLHTSEGLQGRMNEGDPSIIRSSEWRDDTWQRPCCCSTIRGTRHGRRRAHSRGIRRRSIQMGLQELRNIHTIPRASAIIITTTTTNKLLQAACLRFPVMCNAVSSLMRVFSAALAATFSLFFHLLPSYKVPPCLASLTTP